MNEMLTVIVDVMMTIASVVLYVFVMRTVLPKFVMRRRYFTSDKLGRGMKKYVSGDDRAIVYDTAPSIRKYVKKYALIQSGGQKYLKCLTDDFVRTIEYSIIMMDNRNRVVDVLKVEEAPNRCTVCGPIFLHRATSYVALTVHSVNGRVLEDAAIGYYLVRDFGIYTLAVGVASFIEMFFTSSVISDMISTLSAGDMRLLVHPGSLIWSSVLIGAMAAVILLFNCNKKGISVLWNA